MTIKLNNLLKVICVSVVISSVTFQSSIGFAAKSSQPAVVEMEDSYFSPATITISAGQKVVWINKGEKDHSVVSYNGYFDSHHIAPGAKFSYTFNKPGTYAYYCSRHSILHMGMVGKVIVK